MAARARKSVDGRVSGANKGENQLLQVDEIETKVGEPLSHWILKIIVGVAGALLLLWRVPFSGDKPEVDPHPLRARQPDGVVTAPSLPVPEHSHHRAPPLIAEGGFDVRTAAAPRASAPSLLTSSPLARGVAFPPPTPVPVVVGYRPLPPFNASRCPPSTVLDGSCAHANNGLACAPAKAKPGTSAGTGVGADAGCQRPCGGFGLKLRGAGGIVLREGLFMPLYGGSGFGKGLDESFVVSEGWSVAAAQNRAKMGKYEARNGVFVTALRHPVDRVLSRYWYEGRWEMGRGKEASEATAKSLPAWVAEVRAKERGAKPPARLWSCVSNYYVKTLAGWLGSPLCAPPAAAVDPEGGGNGGEPGGEYGCVDGAGPRQLAEAKRVLEARFHVVLVTEWLDHAAQIEWLGQVFCFPTDPRVTRNHPKLGKVFFPNMMKKSAPGGNSKHRPIRWEPEAASLAELRRLNALDLELFAWAAARTRQILEALNTTRGGAFPPLPALKT